MPRLSRRSLFVGAAALPVLAVPRPLASGVVITVPTIGAAGWVRTKRFRRLPNGNFRWGMHFDGGIGEHGPELVLPLRRGANGRLGIAKSVAAPADDAIDDRAFEG